MLEKKLDSLLTDIKNPMPPDFYSKKKSPRPPSVVKLLVLYVLLNILNTMLRGAIPSVKVI
jgi:hypothetical protein